MDLRCFICLEAVESLKVLKNHIRNQHTIFSSKVLQCNQGNPACQRTFSSHHNLYKHISKEHLYFKQPSRLYEISESLDEDYIDLNYPNSVTDYSVSVGGDEENFNVHEFEFLLSMYATPNMNRKNIADILSGVRTLMAGKFHHEDSFMNIETEAKFLNAMKVKRLTLQHKSLKFAYSPTLTNKNNMHVLKSKPVSCEVVSIEDLFKLIFSAPIILQAAKKYMSSFSPGICDIKDGTIASEWPENVLPYVIFYDEIECGNPLGAQKGLNKIGILMLSLRCFSTQMYSKLDNIYLLAAIPPHTKQYLNDIMGYFTSEIRLLQEEGIFFNGEKVYFKLIGICGDNLGQHQILGFVESFSANFPCISCKCTKTECRTGTTIDRSKLRSIENYNEDIELNDPSKTGLKFRSVLNEIPGFHVTQNVLFDMMHDCLEGVFNFGLAQIIHYIVENDMVSVSILNALIEKFPFGSKAIKPPTLKLRDIREKKLPLGAAQTCSLTFYLGLIIGHMMPENNPVWEYYLVLHQISIIVSYKTISLDYTEYLENLITTHHKMYMDVFKTHLRPKHHHLLHYKDTILKFGPLSHYWGMRFEGKNHEIKLYTQSMMSRVNLAKSIMIKDSHRI